MYKDRGIIKWAPFDALVGFKSMIASLIENQNKIEKPILLEDKIEEINQLLIEIKLNSKEAMYYYYENGYIKNTYGKIKFFDKLNNLIYLENRFKLDLLNLLDIEIIS